MKICPIPTSIRSRILLIVVPAVAIAAVVGAAFFTPSPLAVERAEPGRDGTPEFDPTKAAKVDIGEILEVFVAPASRDLKVSDEIWPAFRGPQLDFIAPADYPVPLDPGFRNDGVVRKAPMAEQGILWTVGMGEGYAAPAIAEGCAFVLDYDELKRADSLRCFDLETGEELWRRWYRVDVKRNHGLSRTVPAISDGVVVTLGPRGQVMACETENGKLLWGIDLVREYGTEIPDWHVGQCPVIVDGKVLLAPTGTEAMFLAVDLHTGEVAWKTPNPEGWKMSHASLTIVELGGERVAINLALGGIIGVAIDGERAGETVFESDAWTEAVIVPSPVMLPGNRILVTAGYGAGGALLQLNPNEDGKTFDVELADEWLPPQGISSEQQTPVVYGDYVFCVLPKSAARYREQMACYHADDLRKPVWTSGRERYGLGPYFIADDYLIVMDDHAAVSFLELSTEEFKPVAAVKFLEDGYDSWGPLALSDGKLIARDSLVMACLDLEKLRFDNQVETAQVVTRP